MNTISKPLWVIGHRVTILETIGDYAMLEIVTAAGVPGPPPHYHDRFSELFYVADGVLDIVADGAWRTLKQGQSASIPAGVVHTFRNPGSRPTTWITAFSPRGFERFFMDFGVSVDRPGAEVASVAPELLDRLGREAAGYGMIIQH